MAKQKKKIFAEMLALALVFGMALAGCDDGTTDSGGPSDTSAKSMTIEGKAADGKNVVIKIAHNATDAASAYMPGGNDRYTVKYDGILIDKGSASVPASGTGTAKFTSDEAPAVFTLALNAGTVTSITVTITKTITDSSTASVPDTITVTGINADYNSGTHGGTHGRNAIGLNVRF